MRPITSGEPSCQEGEPRHREGTHRSHRADQERSGPRGLAHDGARERQGFRATSLETLRQMVAAGVGVTLLPVLSVQPPVASNPALRIVAFEEPSPKRSLGLIWRRQSARANLMPMLAEVLRSLPEGLLSTESFNSE